MRDALGILARLLVAADKGVAVDWDRWAKQERLTEGASGRNGRDAGRSESTGGEGRNPLVGYRSATRLQSSVHER